MDTWVNELFSSNRPIGIVLFVGLFIYVIADMMKKSNRIDELLKQLTYMSKDVHDLRNSVQIDRATGEIIRRDMEEFKKHMLSVSHKVVRLETKIKTRPTEGSDDDA